MDEAWMRFEGSGKVTDYLYFKSKETAEPHELAGIGGEERPDGTEYHGDRDGLKCNANWRL